jgi:hypothetical protein
MSTLNGEIVQLQLPVMLLQQVQETNILNKSLEQILIESIQLWLDNQRVNKAKVEMSSATQFLREIGLVMSREQQTKFVQSIKPQGELPLRAEVEAVLADFNPMLSEEIIAMRGER